MLLCTKADVIAQVSGADARCVSASDGDLVTLALSDARAKSTPKTRNALLTIEGVNEIIRAAIDAAMEELVSLVKEYNGGDVSWSMVDRDHPWAVME